MTAHIRGSLAGLALLAGAALLGAGGHSAQPRAAHPAEAAPAQSSAAHSDAATPGTHAADTAAEVTWRLLAELNYRTGEKSEELAALDGMLIRVPGFTVPLEDFASSATEFLLVPYVGACIHVPPPPPNQLVYILMDEGKRAKMDGWNPVWVEGVLTIEMTESVYGSVGFTISGHRVYPYEY